MLGIVAQTNHLQSHPPEEVHFFFSFCLTAVEPEKDFPFSMSHTNLVLQVFYTYCDMRHMLPLLKISSVFALRAAYCEFVKKCKTVTLYAVQTLFQFSTFDIVHRINDLY